MHTLGLRVRAFTLAIIALALALGPTIQMVGAVNPIVTPAASDDMYVTSADTPVVPLQVGAPGVLANDYGAGLTAVKVADPMHGTVTLNMDGSFTYTPTANFAGNDSFTYKAHNAQGDSNVATVTIAVGHVNQPPVITVPGSQNAVQAVALVFSTANSNPITVTDPDAGSGPILVTLSVTNGTINVPMTAGVTVMNNASASVTLTGAFAAINMALNGTSYTSSAMFAGTDTLTVTANDQGNMGSGGPQMAMPKTVSIMVDAQPAVTMTTPNNMAMNVALNSTVTITFNKSVTVTGSAFKLECPVGTPVAFTGPASMTGTNFTLTPTAPLPSGVTCTVTAVAAQITDSFGTHPTADYVFTFTTDTAPTVTMTTPNNMAMNVALNSAVTITFSKPVNLTGTAFKLECPVGTPVAFMTAPASPASAYTLTPTAPLPSGVPCTVTAVAAQITDAAGTHLGSDFVFTFSTDIAPTVTMTTPNNMAMNVAPSSAVTITFSKPVTVTGTAFKLECPVGTPVTFTVSPASPASAYTLTPSAPLPAATTCTVTAVASQITDAAGTNLASDFVFTFSTDTPPTVMSVTPANNAMNVAPSTAVTITFSKAVNVTGTAFKLECPVGTPEMFTISPMPPGSATTFTLTPSAALPVATTCTVTAVASQITDLAGTNLANDFTSTFTTGTPPTVTMTTPNNMAMNVLASTTVTITFSKAVNVTGTAFKLECPVGTPITFMAAPAPPGGVATFTLTPSANLPAGTTCTVTAVASQITDAMTGINLASDFVFSFTVDTPPTVMSVMPMSGATNVAPSTTVTITFNKAVNVSMMTPFKLECPVGTPEMFTISPMPPGGATTFTLTPSAPLPAGVTCTVTAVAAQITDLAGTHLATDFTSTFTTDSPPTVTMTTPNNMAMNVLANTPISITFSKAVNVTGTAFKLECPVGTPITFMTTPAPPGGATTFTLTPSAPLPAGATCTVTVVANQVSDVAASTAMAMDFVFSFTVDTPPTVMSTMPINGATNVVPNSAVTITFSKAVNVTGTAFKLECPVGTPEMFTISPMPPGSATTFTLTPSMNLPADTTCTVTAVAAQISDLVGTNLAMDYVFSFSTPPIAHADTYPETVVGNVSVNSATISYSVTANDTFNNPVTITAFDAASANGGTVSMTTSGAGIGQFTYNPPVGFQGMDTFTYTISNANGSSTATVTIPVSGMIWFINNTAGAGDGRLSSPFNSLGAFQAVNDGGLHHPNNNDNIFLYDSATSYAGPVTLRDGQKLIGQDATSSLTTITGLTPGTSSAPLPATSGGTPNKVTVTSTGNTVTLGSGNTVWGMSLGNASGTALTGASVGTLKLRELPINTTGAAINLSTGTLDAILPTVSAGGGTNGIRLSGTAGTFTVTGDGASDPANTTRGRTTAKNGGGMITPGSGGTIQNASGAGISLSNVGTVTLTSMVVQNNGGAGVNTGGNGITATAVATGLTLDNVKISGQTGNFGLNGTTVSGLTLQHTEVSGNATNSGVVGGANHSWNVGLTSLGGTATFANSLFSNSYENVVGVTQNGTDTVTLNVTNSRFDTATTNETFNFTTNGNAHSTISITGSSITLAKTTGFQYAGNDDSYGSVTVDNNQFGSTTAGDQNGVDIDIDHQGGNPTSASNSRQLTFEVSGNTTRQSFKTGTSVSINIDLAGNSTSGSKMVGTVKGNTIGNSGVANSGSDLGAGVQIHSQGNGTLTIAMKSNTLDQVRGTTNSVVFILNGTGSTTSSTSTLNLYLHDNIVNAPSEIFGAGFEIDNGANTGDSGTMFIDVGNNTTPGNNSATVNAGAIGGLTVQNSGGSPTTDVMNYTGAANDATAIANYITSKNGTLSPPPQVTPAAGTIQGTGTSPTFPT